MVVLTVIPTDIVFLAYLNAFIELPGVKQLIAFFNLCQ